MLRKEDYAAGEAEVVANASAESDPAADGERPII
jgi:hypothetical protein